MAEQVGAAHELGWFWGESDPKTATIIGIFGEVRINTRHVFDLEKTTAGAASYGFGLCSEESMPTQQIILKAYAEMKGEPHEYDPEGIQKTVIDKLRECESDDRREVFRELGELAAGDSEIVAGLATRAAEVVEGERPYNAIPLMSALSTMALHRLVVTDLTVGRGGSLLIPAHSPLGMDHHPAFREPRPVVE